MSVRTATLCGFAAAAVVWGCTASAEAGEAKLRSPVDVAAQREVFKDAKPEPLKCPEPDRLPGAVSEIGYYTDAGVWSKADPEKVKQFYAAMAPLRNGEEALAHALTGFVKAAPDAQEPYARCLLKWLDRFVADEAIVGSSGFRGTSQARLWATTPIFAYVVLRDAYPVPEAEARAIEAWIRRLAALLVEHESKYRKDVSNIDDWAAAALAVAAVALQERGLLETAIGIVERHAATVTEEGVLPSEMARGDRALEYSLFAIQAMAVVLAVAERNGFEGLTTSSHGAIARLMATVAGAILDPQSFPAARANPAMASKEHIYAQNLAWTALARRYGAHSALTRLYCESRPLYGFREGGDWDVFFGQPSACAK